MRYSCSPNSERDRNPYATNHAIWATRPLTQRLIDYASGDIQSLLDLRVEQRAKADATPGAEEHCFNASVKASEFYKKLMTTTKVSPWKMGHFIGPKGSNIHSLMEQMPGVFYQTHGKRGPHRDNLLVYADDAEQLDEAVAMAAPYR